MQKITPFLWFDNNAEEAMGFYTTVFKHSKVLSVSRYPEGGPMPAGLAMTVTFELEGQPLILLNAGPVFPQTPAFSLSVDCDTQEEIDRYWEQLTADGGSESKCGWLKDKFGVSWQIVPRKMGALMSGEHPERAQRVMQAMMKMVKLDIAVLEQAYEGK
ncbi:VOC family protein [Chitinophaga pendula]|uniref:VOC family protein n=1 Tax=Chitinophaga TaxID=79328 RepID=UPI000BB0CBE6|nr:MULTISPECIES: VOC family protein [Chitinophaga]ASZ11677.1 hypothetical protein CK934_12250 [Chitinophaga sp. MD30]UCJ05310.1 VOC family protein [Chitinophaga pendula]